MNRRFVSIGECMVEMAPALEPGRYAMGFAGDTFNTAWYARRMLHEGWSVDYVTAVGIDAASRGMLAFMENAGIGTDHVARRTDRTVGLYLIELDGAERHFSYWRGQSAARTLADDLGALRAALRGAEVVYFSGITLGILEPAARGVLLDGVAEARADGATVALDPNLRPRLWSGKDAMCTAVMQAAAVSDIVLPSFEDEAAHFGDADPVATARRYAGQGAGLVVVKNGAGEIVTLADGAWQTHQPVLVQSPIDTTAAGDSFNAGFLSAYLQSAGLGAAVQAASALAAQVICARGALVPVS